MTVRGYTLGDFSAEAGIEYVVIHARADGQGRFTQANGLPLPALLPGAAVQLRLRATQLQDREQRKSLTTWEARPLLPASQVLFAVVDARALHEPAHAERLEALGLLDVLGQGRQLADHFRQRDSGMTYSALSQGPKAHEGLLELRLEEPLVMERKGLKTYRLKPCLCRVPALPNASSDSGHDRSLNHALTRISETLELHRISHTGNAFTRYLVLEQGQAGGVLRRLVDWRDRVESG